MRGDSSHEQRRVSRSLQRISRHRSVWTNADSVEKQQNPQEHMTEATRTSTETYSQQTTHGHSEVSNDE